MKLTPLFPLFTCVLLAAGAQGPPKVPAPPLESGEALVLAGPDGVVHRFGEAKRETPMGGLAWLPWLRLEGSEWGAADVTFKCTGSLNGYACTLPKGHGRLGLAKAVQVGCDLALLVWANRSAMTWKQDYGDGASRARLEDAFRPFLGPRMPAGEELPELNPAWIGAGALLRTSPDALLAWLLDPAQDEVVRRARRLSLSFMQENFQTGAWWILVAAAPESTVSGTPCAWAVGGNGSLLAVLRLPAGKTPAEGLARFRTVLAVPGR